MPSRQPVVVAIDAGTTGVRALVVTADGTVADSAYRELAQHFPRPGWVEHDPIEIWDSVVDTLGEVTARLDPATAALRAVGLTNQRETVVAWDRSTGQPAHRAIVWQDRRTAGLCRELEDAGHLPLVRERTGLVLDPYFSASKMRWLLTDGGVEPGPNLALGTIDSWILWNLTGGTSGGLFATDATNASRTMLFDIVVRRWSDDLCDLFSVPRRSLPEVHPSCGRFGQIHPEIFGTASPLSGVPVSGLAGDQHAALFGQACFDSGMAKVTYGTGSFILANAGGSCPPPVDGLVTTIGWDLGTDGAAAIGADGGTAGPNGDGRSPVAYALEGSVFTSGAAIQWLRDGLGIIGSAAELEPLARSVESSEGVVVVPAFTGLGSPHFDPWARGTIVGLSRGLGRAHLARAVVEAISLQVRDVLTAMEGSGGVGVTALRADGGASAMTLLLQLQADQTRLPVSRPAAVETTAIGAAMLAGLAEGVWGSLDALSDLWQPDVTCEPVCPVEEATMLHDRWLDALGRARSRPEER